MIYDKKTNTIREKGEMNPLVYALAGEPLKSYPCHPSCKELWEDGCERTEGVHYTLETAYHSDCDDGKKCTLHCHSVCEKIDNPYLIATPIQEESEDEVWQDVIKVVETNQFLSTKYKEVTDTLKKSFTIKRKV